MIYHLSRPAEGGMLRVLLKVLHAFNHQGLSQELWTKLQGGELIETATKLGVTYRYWPLSDKMSILDPLAYLKQFRLNDGMVFYHGFKSFLVANPGRNPAILCLYNSLFPPHGTTNLRYKALSFVKDRLKNLRGVVVASASQAKEARIIFPKVWVIPSGVDTARFMPSDIKKKTIGFLGRLRKEKGVDLLLEAAKHFKDWTFEFAGPDLDGYANRTLPHNVKLLGQVSNPELVINKWSIMVLPSYTEAMPLSILEGMSCGLSIVATDTGDIKEMLGDGKEGVVIPVGDGRRLIDALNALTSDAIKRKELGIRAREKALKFDWSKIENMWLSLITDWR